MAEKVAVIGGGKMGLPVAASLAHGGAIVTVCDVNAAIVESINRGVAPFEEPGLSAVLSEAVAGGALRATTDTVDAVSESSVVIVLVPLLLTPDFEADWSIIRDVSLDIAQGLKPGTLVIYETTLPVGGTRSLLPTLQSSGLVAGRDFDLAFSPERVKSQLVLAHLSANAKIVGGLDAKAALRAAEFYKRYLGVKTINVDTLEAAELAKLAGMVYRDVNIALANELSRYADAVGVDIGPVITAANTDGEAAILEPGIGVGGHCTPIYPYFLINDARRRNVPAFLSGIGRTVNDSQPAYVVAELEKRYGNLAGKAALILGLAFRPQVKESICSPAFLLQKELARKGARIFLCDPLYTKEEIAQLGFEPWELGQAAVPEIVLLATAHEAFKSMDMRDLQGKGCRVLVDGRNFWNALEAKEAGLLYIGIGRGGELKVGRAADRFCGSGRMPVAKPVLGIPEIAAAGRAINSGWIMQGERVSALETEFTRFVGAPFATCVSSGTAALHLALLGSGVGPGDEVITVSHSFIATANSIRYCGATPVFVDVQPGTFNIDVGLIEAAVSDKTKAILCVHQMGMPCDLSAILEIGKKRGLPVIEDAACALGSEILWQGKWERIGKPHGDLVCFSFHPRKLLTTGDGGLIVSKDEGMDRLFKKLRNHGLEDGKHTLLGFNYRMTDLQAAVGAEQLKRLPQMVEKRRRQAELYRRLLGGVERLTLPEETPWARSNWQSFAIRLPDMETRDRLGKIMDEQGIDTRGGIACAHREEAYRHEAWFCSDRKQESSSRLLKVSEESQDRCLILPLYHQMSDEDIQGVVGIIKDALSS